MTTQELSRPRHDRDFYAWALDQARRLRELARLRPNEPIDWELLADEVEDMGKTTWRTCASLLELIVAHLLKLAWSGQDGPRGHWRGEIAAFRSELSDALTTAIENDLKAELERRYQRARKRAIERLAEEEPDFPARLPESCPYTWEQITGDWLPERAVAEPPEPRRRPRRRG